MHTLLLPLSARFIAYTLAVALTIIVLLALIFGSPPLYLAIPLLAVFGALAIIGTRDLIQTRHAVLRNYPLTAHIRFILEEIRPEIRQYFLESEKDGTPFSRDKRAIVYQRAKQALDKRPFGTQNDVYASGYEWLQHSMAPKLAVKEPFRIAIGGPDCAKPYLGLDLQHFGDELRRAQPERHPRAQHRGAKRAASRMIPARAATAPITANMAATSSGRSARAISAAATATARSAPKNSRPMRRATRSR